MIYCGSDVFIKEFTIGNAHAERVGLNAWAPPCRTYIHIIIIIISP